MSYGMTAALQSAVYGRLSADAGLAAIVGTDASMAGSSRDRSPRST